ERMRRAQNRGVKYIICPYRDAYYKYLAPHAGPDMELAWFPIAPSIEHYPNRTTPLSERKFAVLGSGFTNAESLGCYDFRRWAYRQPYVSTVPHCLDGDNSVPQGADFGNFLSQYAGALALTEFFPIPKYFEIPLAGCVCFAQYHKEYEDLGFRSGTHYIGIRDVSECHDNFEKSIKDFIARPADFQHIADAGRQLVESKYTATHFADYIYKLAEENYGT
ncbi:unnamed protein product, partial [marine sediment metagenome]